MKRKNVIKVFENELDSLEVELIHGHNFSGIKSQVSVNRQTLKNIIKHGRNVLKNHIKMED